MENEIITGLIIGVVSILLGILVYKYKLDWMISGYNTLSKDKKKNVQIEKIRVLFLIFFTATGAILIINALLSNFVDLNFVHPVGIILIIVLFLIVNYSIGKYDKNKNGGMITLYKLFRKS